MHRWNHGPDVGDLLEIAGGIGVGAALAYVLDPEVGNRRRAILRDHATHAMSRAVRAADITWRDLNNRVHGTMAEIASSFKAEQPTDDVLTARVRSKIGRHVAHPSFIEVDVGDGRVVLRGDVLQKEEAGLLSAVKSIRGVKRVENSLRIHASAEGIPGLQSGRPRTGQAPALIWRNWSPTARLLVGTGGVILAIECLRHRALASTAFGILGLGMLLAHHPTTE